MATPTTAQIEEARALEKSALAALRQNNWSEAEQAAKGFLRSGFESLSVRRVLAAVAENRNDLDAAAGHLQTALTKFPGNAHAWEQLSRLKWRFGKAAFLEFFRDYPNAYPGLFDKKVNYYHIASFYTQFNATQGLPAVVDCASAIMTVRETRDAVSAAVRERMSDPSEHGAEVVDDPRLVSAFRALATNPGETILQVAAFLEDPAADHAQLQRLLKNGPDQGHPVWHVINPHFHLWCGAGLEGANAQARWRDTEAVARETPLANLRTEYQDWLSEQDDSNARDVLEQVIAGFETAPRILDLGCGKGFWLRFFAERCGVPVENLRGMELHESRAENARQGLLDVASGSTDAPGKAEAIRRNVQAGDLLDPEALGRLGQDSVPDIATLFVVTGCFEDDQLGVLMRGLDALAATRLVVTSVSKRWDFWHGRTDEDAYFERTGYRLAARHWDPETLQPDGRWQAIAARKYWVDRRVSVYQRER